MTYLFNGADVWDGSCFKRMDIAVSDGRIVFVSPDFSLLADCEVIQADNCILTPGFVDVHVHLRSPGFSYKETMASGTKAAAAGGYTHVLSMPNLNPVPDSLEHLREQLDLIESEAVVSVIPYGSITVGEKGEQLSDFDDMAPYIAGFSDDGRGVQSEDMMRLAMEKAAKLGKPIVSHCEVDALLCGGYIHDGEWAKTHGFKGISSESEWRQVERDIELVRETGCKYHVCHVSTGESVELIRGAKREGLPVTCETAPHYLILCEEDLKDEGRFKMNPPLRSAQDREELIRGLLDGTIDCIATDHAPHSSEEKAGGLRDSLMGVVGLETAFPVLYTRLVKNGRVPIEILLDRLIKRPREIFSLPGGRIEEGGKADFTVIKLDETYKINPGEFHSMGRATPFDGESVKSRVMMTFCEGKMVYRR